METSLATGSSCDFVHEAGSQDYNEKLITEKLIPLTIWMNNICLVENPAKTAL